MTVDSHCHLADEKFAGDLDAVVSRATAAGVTAALCVLAAEDDAELARASQIKALWPSIRFAAAIHPHTAARFAPDPAEARLVVEAALRATDAAVVGEIGLDYHYDFSPRPVQRAVLAEQIGLALDTNRPVAIHTREAWPDTVAALRTEGGGRLRGVMHCFSEGPDALREALDLGFFISIAGIVTFPKAAALREVALAIPADRLLVETDAPFLAPVPHRGKRNEPAWVVETQGELARLRGISSAELGDQVRANFAAFLGI